MRRFESSRPSQAPLARDLANGRDLALSLEKIGDLKLRAGEAAGALAAYEESLAIRRDIAKDKSNAQAQRDLSVSLNKIGKTQPEVVPPSFFVRNA
jgi:predicted TPR repeat methyltransferase